MSAEKMSKTNKEGKKSGQSDKGGTEYSALALRYRPTKFAEVVHQAHVVKTLQNAIQQDRVGHAFIFAGPRGVGKTSLARIFAKALNCLKGPAAEPCGKCEVCQEMAAGSCLDFIEIDGASNRGIDQARDLRERVRYTPVKARYKVYVIDEVHMLTTEAFNALLKTLEEPPPHVKFIFATTEYHKLLPTIISRCQLFFFRRIPAKEIITSLKAIVKAEAVKADEESLYLVARSSDGSLRDAQSILDQLLVYGEGTLKVENVIELLGLSDPELVYAFVSSARNGEVEKVLQLVAQLSARGGDMAAFLDDVTEMYRNLLLIKNTTNPKDVVIASDDMMARLEGDARLCDEERLIQAITLVSGLREKLRFVPNQRIALEVLGLKLCRLDQMVTLRQLVSGAPPVGELKETKKKALDEEEPKEGLSDADYGEPTLIVSGIEEVDEEAEGRLSLPRIQRNWEGFLASMQGRETLKTKALLSAGRPAKLQDYSLMVVYDSGYHVEQLNGPLHREAINAALKAYFSEPIKFEAFIKPKRKEKEARKMAAQAEMASRKNREEKIKQAEQDPLVQKAINVFKGKIVDVITEERERNV